MHSKEARRVMCTTCRAGTVLSIVRSLLIVVTCGICSVGMISLANDRVRWGSKDLAYMHLRRARNWEINQYPNIAIVIPWFQPVKTHRPLANMLLLLHKLDALDMPYYISELAPDDAPFEFDSNPNVFHFRSNAPYMWHKENLVVQAVRRLPPHITKIVWLDKDVWFDDDNWLSRVDKLLDEVDFVQPFERFCMQTPDLAGCLPSIYNFSKVAEFLAGCDVKRRACGHPGLALGVRREIVQELGLMERSIIGSGDQLLWNAVFNHTAPTSPKHITKLIPRVGIQYTEFRLGLPRVLGRPQRVAYLHNVTARHMYHGSPKNKQHIARILMVLRQNFTSNDFFMNNYSMWALRQPKRWKPMFSKYFIGRDEDSVDIRDLSPVSAGNGLPLALNLSGSAP